MMHMLGDQSLFGDGGDRGRRGEGVGGDLLWNYYYYMAASKSQKLSL